jgi:4-hydroxy-tetrahydrodipicolinate synthase
MHRLSALTRENFVGPWAGLPVAWTDDDRFDEATYRGDVARCCDAGIPGIYTGGTTGEFYALEWEEFAAITRVTVEEAHAHRRWAMIGCTATSTRSAARRAAFAAEIGADAVQIALPFWMEVPDDQVVPFVREVARAAEHVPLSIYETRRARKTLTLDQHRAIKEAVPEYLMVKANEGTVAATGDGCSALSHYVNVFTGERLWAALGPHGVTGACSAMIYWNPQLVLGLWNDLRTGNWPAIRAAVEPVESLHDFLATKFGPLGFTDTAYDRLGARTTEFLKTSLCSRGPYRSASAEDVEILRHWCRTHYPELLELNPFKKEH